jgi:hypothetical protein
MTIIRSVRAKEIAMQQRFSLNLMGYHYVAYHCLPDHFAQHHHITIIWNSCFKNHTFWPIVTQQSQYTTDPGYSNQLLPDTTKLYYDTQVHKTMPVIL